MTVKAIEAALVTARALVASLEAALEQAREPQEDPALDLRKAAEMASLSPHTLRSWCRSGRLKCSRGARGAYLVRMSDVDVAVEAGTPPTPRTRSVARDLEEWDREAEAELRRMSQ